MSTRAYAVLAGGESEWRHPDDRIHPVRCQDCGACVGHVILTESRSSTPRYWFSPLGGWIKRRGVWCEAPHASLLPKLSIYGTRLYRLPVEARCSRCRLRQTLDAHHLALPPWTASKLAEIAERLSGLSPTLHS